MDPRTGRWYDDLKPLIDNISCLTDEQRQQMYHTNAEQIFTHYAVGSAAPTVAGR